MSIAPAIQAHNLSQAAQTGGYWLITVELFTQLKELHAVYALEAAPTQPLSLFDYQFPKLQLLSQQPIDEALLQTESNLTLHACCGKLTFDSKTPTLMLASDLGIGPLFYVGRQLKGTPFNHLALLHASAGFPFAVKPAQFMLSDLPFEAIGSCSLLEDWRIANRLASDLGLPGCFDGDIAALFEHWLSAEAERQSSDKTQVQWQILSFLPQQQNQQLKQQLESIPWLDLNSIDTTN